MLVPMYVHTLARQCLKRMLVGTYVNVFEKLIHTYNSANTH
jgi:hypothetical protein